MNKITRKYIFFIIIIISLVLYFYLNTTKIYNINVIEDDINIKNLKKQLDLCVKNRVPTVIKNGLKYFPEIHKWNEEYIYKKYGDKKCSVATDGKRVERHFTDKNMNYKEYFEKNKNLYLFSRESYHKKKLNTYIDDLTFPNPFFNKKEIHHNVFYTGPESSGILPHSHGDAFNLMLYGEKKWILFDYNNKTGKLNDFYERKYKKNIEWKNWYKNEYKNLISKTDVIEFIQYPNDIVFVPRGYLHSVYNNKNTMGILIEKIEKYI